jgi:putative tryptophan/tyrosine transport system substrate-binding protein
MNPDVRHPRSRRQFLQSAADLGLTATGLALLAGCGHPSYPAPPPPKAAAIGYLLPGRPAPFRLSDVDAFRRGLRELGYVEGHNIAIEWRYTEGDPSRTADIVAELVRLPVDVIIAPGALEARPARSVTATIPIVTVVMGDPVGTGLVTSLARPGGNVTGLTSITSTLAAKRLQLLTEAVPGLARVAVLWNASNPDMIKAFQETEAAAHALGVELQSLGVRGEDEIDAALETARRPAAQALVVLVDSLVSLKSLSIIGFAASTRLPAMYSLRFFVNTGGLMAYTPNYSELHHRAAAYVDKILKGAKPADLPLEQPMTFDFVVNLKTARELGIAFPNEIMLQVTEVIDQ